MMLWFGSMFQTQNREYLLLDITLTPVRQVIVGNSLLQPVVSIKS